MVWRVTLGCHPPFLAHHHPTRPYQERAGESCAIPVGFQVAISRKLGCGCVRFDPPLWLPRCHDAHPQRAPRGGAADKRREAGIVRWTERVRVLWLWHHAMDGRGGAAVCGGDDFNRHSQIYTMLFTWEAEHSHVEDQQRGGSIPRGKGDRQRSE